MPFQPVIFLACHGMLLANINPLPSFRNLRLKFITRIKYEEGIIAVLNSQNRSATASSRFFLVCWKKKLQKVKSIFAQPGCHSNLKGAVLTQRPTLISWPCGQPARNYPLAPRVAIACGSISLYILLGAILSIWI